MHLSIYCDGAARGNPGPAAYGFLVRDQQGQILHEEGGFLGKRTNNEAEYQAVIQALRFLSLFEPLGGEQVRRKKWRLDFHLDSQLVVEQLNGHFKIREERMRELLVQVRENESAFGSVEYDWIPRHENRQADRLANRALNSLYG